jgi:hypothetical protein
MPRVGFEPMTPKFERTKIFYVSHRAVIGSDVLLGLNSKKPIRKQPNSTDIIVGLIQSILL